MTLIVKELIIKGVVSNSYSEYQDTSMSKDDLRAYLDDLKKEIESNCLEKIWQRVEARSNR